MSNQLTQGEHMDIPETSTIKYVTISIDETVKNDLSDIAVAYAKTVGVRRISMNDLVLIMLKNFKETVIA